MSQRNLLTAAYLAVLPLLSASPAGINGLVISDRLSSATLDRSTNKRGASLSVCGDQHYNPNEFTCFDNELLCPWQSGWPQFRCGKTSKCYLPLRYNCENGNLTEIPVIQKPFELEAWNLVKPLKVKIKACGHNFWLKENDEDSCTLCPEKIRRQGACPPGKDAVFLPGRNMATLVPGGQRYYVNPIDGALQFSIPHSSIDPKGAISDIIALQNGTFAVSPGVKGWLACPRHTKISTGEEFVRWQIHAQLPNLDDVKDCLPVNLVTVPWKPKEDSNTTFAAWEYV